MWVIDYYAHLSCRGEWKAKDTLCPDRGGTEALERYINEGISCRRRTVDISPLVNIGGGIPDKITSNETIYGRDERRTVQTRDSLNYRGGIPNWKPYILESYYYADKDEIQKLMPYFGDFLLDSGAFTFMQNSKTHVDWNNYLENYADFINTYKVDKFFELDIDSVVGYDNVLKMRSRLEKLTGRQCIPVWHISRGKDDFLRMCDEYPYIAIGGLVGKASRSKKKQQQLERSFPWFINEAHKRGAKIHGLGYTSDAGIRKYHFDSVDSTAWTTGNRFGHAYTFNGKGLTKTDKPEGSRIPKDKVRELAVNNFIEWCKFQQWAEVHL
jgi:hypothetical protein